MADQTRRMKRLAARFGLLRRFARAQDGATAIEFAFVAMPFLLLVFMILELGLTFLASMTLENALMIASRTIRTGDMQTSGSQAAFRTAVCNQMSWLSGSCSSSLIVDVRTLTSFASSSSQTAPKASKTCWDPGGPSSIVLVRAYYKWPMLTPLMSNAVGGSTGNRQIAFSALFSNEPYSDTPAATVTCPT